MAKVTKGLKLENRGILRLSGTETRSLLQGLITNDLNRLSADQPLYAALLSPQGKFLFDFFIYEDGEDLLLDCEKARLKELIKRLTFYKLRADVTIEEISQDLSVWAFAPGQAPDNTGEGFVFPDPRLKEMGFRGLLAKAPEGLKPWTFKDYEALRLELGVPDGARDIEVDKRFILEANLAELNGVDFDKGCYVGQELTARMNYRGTLKKRLLPAKIEGPLPPAGEEFFQNGKKAGHVLSGQNGQAMTLTRLAFLNKGPFETGSGAKIRVYVPDWLSL